MPIRASSDVEHDAITGLPCSDLTIVIKAVKKSSERGDGGVVVDFQGLLGHSIFPGVSFELA
jgi:hypothetical protein